MGKQIGLAAPTGRAAQRLSEMTGLDAQTLHRLLEFSPATRGFKRGRDNPLPYEALVVDESSMLDLFLAHALFKALAPEAQILLVGDVDQLPSVGPGKVLADLIDSELIPVVRLSQVFRQAQTSGIVQAAHQNQSRSISCTGEDQGAAPIRLSLAPRGDRPRTGLASDSGIVARLPAATGD